MSATNPGRGAITVATALALSLLPLASAPATAPEPTASQHLEVARVCYAALDFACAEAELSRARAAADTLSAAQRVETLRLSAQTALATERLDEARAHLGDLLRAQPDIEPDARAWPESWRDLIAAVRRSLPDDAAPSVDAHPPAAAPAGLPLVIRAAVRDPSGVARVDLVLSAPTAERVAMRAVDPHVWEATVPAALVRGGHVAFVVEAWDTRGNGPGRSTTAQRPHRVVLAATERPDGSLLTRWWFWTGVGVAAAGLVAALSWSLVDDDPRDVRRIRGHVQWP